MDATGSGHRPVPHSAVDRGSPMTPWQVRTLDRLRIALPEADVEVYGSAADPATLDSWSDLDVRIRTGSPIDVASALGAEIWAFQCSAMPDRTVVRSVLTDGRAVDLSIQGASVDPGDPAPDAAIRFDAALAATRLGRGSELIGLHLVLGILRDTLVQGMLLADRREGSTHHRRATAQDARARAALEIVHGPLTARTALDAYTQYGAWRRDLDPTYSPDPTGLEALIRRGATGHPTGSERRI